MAAALVLVIAIPGIASGHGMLGANDTTLDVHAATTLMSDQADALEQLPPETTSGTCIRTQQVDGLGAACRTDDGLFRVMLPGGRSMETHGVDAPAVQTLAAPHQPQTQAAVDGASVSNIECVTSASERRVEIIYAYPSDRPNRIASMTAPLQQAMYKASAFIDAESQSLNPNAGRRMRVLCSGGLPTVTPVALSALGAASGATFSGVIGDLLGLGYPAVSSNSTSPRRFMVFYDAPSSSGAAGTGHFFDDDVPGTNNFNNKGGRYAVEFDWGSSHLPHWDVMLHEISHNMGAVSDNAPATSGGGHCNDGLDIMCYSDGGSASSYSGSVCSQERYDCGADSYFNPSPAGGSYLANNWNVASTNNQWLQTYDSGWNDGGVPDLNAPTVPGSLAITATAHTTINLAWVASTDDRSTVRYRATVERSQGGSWVADSIIQPISTTTQAVTGLLTGGQYRFRLVAIDQAGNVSGEAIVIGSTSSGPPLAPASIATQLESSGSKVRLIWPIGSAAGGVVGYQVEVQLDSGAWITAGQLAGTEVVFSGLTSGTKYRFRIRTLGSGGTFSDWRLSAVLTSAGVLAGVGDQLSTPIVRLARRTTVAAALTWTAGAGATSWKVVLIDASGRTVATRTNLRSAKVSIAGLKPRARYTALVTAYGSGDVSGAGKLVLATLRDTRPPGAVTVRGRYQRVGTKGVLIWKPAYDASGILRYEIQRKVGARWVKAGVAKGAARKVALKGLTGTSRPMLRIRAIDRAGLHGRWTLAR